MKYPPVDCAGGYFSVLEFHRQIFLCAVFFADCANSIDVFENIVYDKLVQDERSFI